MPTDALAGARTSRLGPLSLFSSPPYRRLWTAAALIGFGQWGERLIVGFLVLAETDSILLTTASFAARSAPGMLVAPFAGALVDRFDRRWLLSTTALAKAALVAALGVLVIGGLDAIWPVFLIVALTGVGQSFSHPATMALTTDIVPRPRRMTAVSVLATGTRAIGVIGALAGGVMIETLGGAPALFLTAGVLAAGGLIAATVRVRRPSEDRSRESVMRGAVDGLRYLTRTQPVAAVLLLALVVEIFGFAYNSVLPVVARDVLEVGATGLGALTLMAGAGALAGVAALSWLGDFPRKGLLLRGATLGFGIAIVAFSGSESFALSVGLIAVIGAMAALFDTLQWTVVQALVPDRMRGRAIAGWVFAIGFGWAGHLLMGVAAEAAGVRWALFGAGVMVIAAAATAFILARRLKWA